MSDYTIVNIRESEDFAPKFGLDAGLNAHFPKKELNCEIGAVGLERLAPGFRTPFGTSTPSRKSCTSSSRAAAG